MYLKYAVLLHTNGPLIVTLNKGHGKLLSAIIGFQSYLLEVMKKKIPFWAGQMRRKEKEDGEK